VPAGFAAPANDSITGSETELPNEAQPFEVAR
jgi:hypothetical protein